MYGGKQTADDDTLFVFASEHERGVRFEAVFWRYARSGWEARPRVD